MVETSQYLSSKLVSFLSYLVFVVHNFDFQKYYNLIDVWNLAVSMWMVWNPSPSLSTVADLSPTLLD